jgi:hypothetical protein
MPMSSDKLVNGHHFNFSTGVCDFCGITQPQFDDRGRPRCTGRREVKERTTIPVDYEPAQIRSDDDEPPKSRRR